MAGETVSWSVDSTDENAAFTTNPPPAVVTDGFGEAEAKVQRTTAGSARIEATWARLGISASIILTWAESPPATEHIHLVKTTAGTGHPCHSSTAVPTGTATAVGSTEENDVGTTQTVVACVHDIAHAAVVGRAVFLETTNRGSAASATPVKLDTTGPNGSVTFTVVSPTAGKTQTTAKADTKASSVYTVTWKRIVTHVHAYVVGQGDCHTATDPARVPINTTATVVACVQGAAHDGLVPSGVDPSTGAGDFDVNTSWAKSGDGSFVGPQDIQTDITGRATAKVRSANLGTARVTATGSTPDSPGPAQASGGVNIEWVRAPDPSGSVFTESLGGALIGGPDATSWAKDHMSVFALGTDKALWQRSWTGSSWTGWSSLGGSFTSDPTAVSWGLNRIDVFGRGADNALWHASYNGTSWSGWQSLGGFITSAPDASSQDTNRLDVFARGGDNALWQNSWTGSGWTGWGSLGGIVSSDPSATSWGPNRIDVFVRGADDALWQRSWDGAGWSGWGSLGGRLIGGPDAASTAVGKLDVFVIGTDQAAWRSSSENGTWTGWGTWGGIFTSDPTAVSWSSDRIDMFARGGDNALWHKWQG